MFLTLFCHLRVKVHMAARDHAGRSLLRRCTQAFAASAVWHLSQNAVGLVLRDWRPKLDHALMEADVCFTKCESYPPFDSKPCAPMASNQKILYFSPRVRTRHSHGTSVKVTKAPPLAKTMPGLSGAKFQPWQG